MFINAVMYEASADRSNLIVLVMYGLFASGKNCGEHVGKWLVDAGHMVHLVTVPSGV